ncbi:MAG: 3-methyl-2-oxobutanoate hydroxymethyltransferase [Myxococcales bacterium]|nr:3-methyl-2-oxobutanoate hydroxymethyltransferase [Myxococcales bacterium]
MKDRGERITMITAYDAMTAKLVERGGADIVLVGDSLGMVVQGKSSTLEVTVDEMIYHGQMVARGLKHVHLVLDMPFMSYQVGVSQAVHNAGRLIKEGRAHAVKLEGGAEYQELIARLVRIGIPVMGHLGLTPQSIHTMGGFKVQGTSTDSANDILHHAQALESAGAYALVLEGIPQELSQMITQALSIPTIGIGAGRECDGQVLVVQDLLGMDMDFKPKFVKAYESLGERIPRAIQKYRDEVRAGIFPGDEHSYFAKTPLFRPGDSAGSERASAALEGERELHKA